jgi:hypothetical protein
MAAAVQLLFSHFLKELFCRLDGDGCHRLFWSACTAAWTSFKSVAVVST